MNLVFMGIQGSGKGLQAELLAKRYGFEHFDLGSELRERVKKDTPFGRMVETYIKDGNLVPDEEIIAFINKKIDDNIKGLVLDGFPRTIAQAKFIVDKIPVKHIVYFALDDETATKRLASRRICSQCKTGYNLLVKPPKVPNVCDVCGGKVVIRHDDHMPAIKRRIKKFHELTEPIIDFFKEGDKLITINAAQSPEMIHKELVEKLNLTN
ncbi:MAG: nucleoside monophosphate kinase [Candidatus Cloacimonadia bacterium]